MAIRTNLLNGNVINKDSDFSKYIETVSEPGVIEGLSVSTSEVAVGKARVPCLRSNGEKLYALVSITSAVSISGEGDVYIEVKQNMIDDGEIANDDGTGIAEIKVGTTPENNALKLAVIDDGVATDKRNMIKKVGELYSAIQVLEGRVGTIEDMVETLVNDGSSALKEAGIVGEKYSLSDRLFRQKTPEYDDCTIDYAIGSTSTNKEIHIQRMGSGTASNKINLKLKSYGSPTTGLVVEVRKGQLESVSDREAFWWGNPGENNANIICSGTISYDTITSSYQMFEITMDGDFGGTKGELLDVVVYQTGLIANASNYYLIACDGTQNSEGFSLVKSNGASIQSRSNLCPYCTADGLLDNMICKVSSAGTSELQSYTISTNYPSSGNTATQSYTTTQAYTNLYINVQQDTTQVASYYEGYEPSDIGSSGAGYVQVLVDNTEVLKLVCSSTSINGNQTIKLANISNGSVITINQVNAGYWREPVPGTSIYHLYSTVSNISLSPNKTIVNRPLVPIEVKSIGLLTYGISHGRLTDGTWYGEFDSEIYESATTGNITLGNCIGFKIITDVNGENYKVPIYGI